MKKSFSGFAIFTITALFFSTNIQAQGDNWSVSASNWMQYWYNQAEPNWIRNDTLPLEKTSRDSLDNRFSVDFNFGDFYAGAWLRTFEPNFTSSSNEKITQRYLGWRQDGLNIHVGNFYKTFDHGLTLNAFLDDAVYFDNNLDGVRVSGMYDHFDFDALSGRGFRFQQGVNEFNLTRDFTIRGARGAVKPITGLKFGGSLVKFKQSSSLQFNQSDDINLSSVNGGISKGPFDIYAEYAFKEGNTGEEEKTDGDGTYLSASFSHRLFSIYSEYKNYYSLLYPGPIGPFNTPPPVSHSGRNLSAMAGVPGETGYQIGALISPNFNLNFEVAFSEAYSRGSKLQYRDSIIYRPDPIDTSLERHVPIGLYLGEKYAGIRWNATDKIVFNAHWDRQDYNGLEGDEIETYFDSYYYLSPSQTVSLATYQRTLSPITGKYHEDYLTLGYSRNNLIEVSIGGSTTNKVYQPFEKADPKRLAFIEATIHYKTNELSILHGGERGGLICSSGICTIRPTFQGTRVILLSRF